MFFPAPKDAKSPCFYGCFELFAVQVFRSPELQAHAIQTRLEKRELKSIKSRGTGIVKNAAHAGTRASRSGGHAISCRMATPTRWRGCPVAMAPSKSALRRPGQSYSLVRETFLSAIRSRQTGMSAPPTSIGREWRLEAGPIMLNPTGISP